MILNGVQHQNAVFGHDADNHDHSHQRNYIERLARNQQGEQNTPQREHRAGHNRDWVRKGTKLNQQGYEHEHDREHQRNQKFAEARLLFLIKASVLDRHCGRKFDLPWQNGFDFINGRAEVLAFQPAGNGDVLAQVLARDLGLSLLVLDIGHLIESKQSAP